MSRGIATIRHKTPLGLLEGLLCRGTYGDLYTSFEGIPYAKPPIEELRFKAPEPLTESWEGVLDCTLPSNEPVQKDFGTGVVFGSEDCLYLNVYVKTLRSKEKLPVMVYFYGGRFVAGYANRAKYNPDYFMMHDVIIVTFNYRVGVLGFLSLCDSELEVPGNAGLKDMVLALRWVKKNIEHFNGDPENITIFGESAGAAAVHMMLTTPQTKKLFHKAIMQSGSMFNPWAYRPPRNLFYQFALDRGYVGKQDEHKILEFLCGLDPYQLVEMDHIHELDNEMGMLQEFGPTIESYNSEQCILCKPFAEAVRTAWGNRIPVIIGGTSFEGLISYGYFLRHPEKYEKLCSDPQLLLPYELQKNAKAERKVQLIRLVLKTFFTEQHKQNDFETETETQETESTVIDFNIAGNKKLKYLDVLSMRYFWHGIYQAIEARLLHATAPTFVYRFDFDSPTFGFRRQLFTNGEVETGVAHADDLQYIFHYHGADQLKKYTKEFRMINRMTSMWTSFALTSDPNCKQIEPTFWCPTRLKDPFACLNLSEHFCMTELPEKHKIRVWQSLFRKHAPCWM